MFTNVKFGLNYTDRSKDRVTDEGLIVSATGGGYDPIALPSGSTTASNIGGTGINMLVFSPQVALIPGAAILRKYNNDILSKTWSVDEKVTTTYGKLDIDTQWANVPIHGNVGAQLVHTDQSSAGFEANVSATPVLSNPALGGGLTTVGTTYNDFLPALNLNGDLGNDTTLRFALGKYDCASEHDRDMRGTFSFSENAKSRNCDQVQRRATTQIPARYEGSGGKPQPETVPCRCAGLVA